jgi:acyl carrier protein
MKIKNKVNKILKKNKIDIKKYNVETNLIQTGIIDSMQLIIIIAEFERNFKIKIDTQIFYKKNFGSLNSFYAIIEKLINANTNSKKN